jgi:RNA recognition motif. (a.k.a. RRM, RBD, or RNP domain)
MNIFVGNLSFEAKEIDVQRAFMAFGVVTSVAIVMEKKGKKSRGFGFVEMPDEQEALAAIAQLQGKEIFGRPINVVEALSKEPKSPTAGKRDQYSSAVVDDNQEGLRAGYKRSNPGHDHSFQRTGKYKQGRRSLSYVKQRRESGITTAAPERRYKSNPMRWIKKPRTPARFAKPEGELKPWQRSQTESNPWKKPKTKFSPWKKPGGESKPWQSPQAEPKPWEKNRSGSRTWKKPEGVAKPWRKSSLGRAQSGFKKRSRFSRP